MSVTVDLGNLDVVASTNDTRLSLESSVVLKGSSHGVNDTEQRRTSTVSLAISNPGAWIRKGHDYRFQLQIAFNEAMEPGMSFLPLGTIAHRLESSKYWGECGLTVTRVEIIDGNPAVLTLGLDYQSSFVKDSAGGPHRLAAGVPLEDIQPPSGILRRNVGEVRLAITFSKPQPVRHLGTIPATLDHNDADVYSPTTAKDMDPSRVHDASSHDHPYPSPPSSQEDTSRLQGCAQSELHLNMLQYAITTAISGPPPRRSSKFSIANIHGLRPLTSLAPALWSQGHLRDVASRTIFLPTIGHAMANVSRHAVRRPELRYKSAEVDRRHRGVPLCPDVVNATGNTALYQRSLEVLAWQSMTTQLRKLGARKNVSRLLDGMTHRPGDGDTFDNILDAEAGQVAFKEVMSEDLDRDETYDSDQDGSCFDELTLDGDDGGSNEWNGSNAPPFDDIIGTDDGHDVQVNSDDDRANWLSDSKVEELWGLHDVDEEWSAEEPVNSRRLYYADDGDGDGDALMLDNR
ncbi:hypothetical protein LTR95_008776 [Oleoguttula sp. CCFEE 5521]